MAVVKLTQIGNSVGVIFPKEMLAKMNVEKGDNLFLSESAIGGYHISPYDEEFARQMEAARKVMKKRRNVLRELAK